MHRNRLHNVLLKVFPDSYFLTEKHYKTKKSKCGGDLYFIDEQQYYAVFECYSLDKVLRINIWYVHVHPNFQNKGYASNLTEQHINSIINKYDWNEVVISAKCRFDNIISMKFLTKIGLYKSNIFVNKRGEHRYIYSTVYWR